MLSIFVSTLVFSASRYRDSTLNIDATSMEKGIGTVHFEGAGSYDNSSRNFEINEYDGDEGLKKLYVIELPATRLKSIRIAPHVRSGFFGVDRIILANDSISYMWDDQGVCYQQIQVTGFHEKEPCLAGSPVISAAADSSIIISAIPETGFINTFESRLQKTLTAGLATVLATLWLLWPSYRHNGTSCFNHFAHKFIWLAIAVGFAYQLYLVTRYSVDIPRQDEWIYFRPDALIKGLTWQWLLGFHGEHPLLLTKLMAWLNLKLFKLDFALQNIFNLLIFGGLLVTILKFKDLVLGRGKFLLFPLFVVFMFSTVNYENHIWALQSNYHLVLLFSLLSLYQTYSRDFSVKPALLFNLYAILAILTYSAGIVFITIYLICVAVFIAAGITGKRINNRSGLIFLLSVCLVCGFNVCLSLLGNGTSTLSSPMTYPNCLKFWDFFLNVISFGFGFKQVNIFPGIICFLMIVLPLFFLLIKKESRWQPSTWLVLTAVLGILAVLAAITLGRAWGYPPKTSRYVEVSFMLIPFTALGWWLVTKEGLQRTSILTILWLFFFASFFDDWSTKGYALYKQFSLYDLQIIEAYYSGKGNKSVPELSIPSDLDTAKKMGVKFARQFNKTGE
jgi:hypothetical protein